MGASGSLILFNGPEFINIITDADAPPVVDRMLWWVGSHQKVFVVCKKIIIDHPKTLPQSLQSHYNNATKT